ncbi:MAG: hypothetical protein PF505_14080, partial [Vallitaleaceae bacterium]|nr:hypothetical protein [Vallitaleaceae bacterium]
LIPWDGSNEGTPVVLSYNSNEHRDLFDGGDIYKYSTRFELGEALITGEYILRITDTSTTPSKSVDTTVYATDASIIEGNNYIGTVNSEIWHKLYFIYDQTATGDVTVYNADDVAIGSGSIEVFDERFHDDLMKTTLDADAEPSYFTIDGALVNNNGDQYNTNETSNDYLWEVTADDTNYYIKMYNDNLTTDYVDDVKIDESNGPTLFDSTNGGQYTVEAMTNTDAANGLMISIPITEFIGNKWCSITIFREGGEDGRGDYFFEDSSQNILSIVTTGPTGPTVIQNVEVAFSTRTEGANTQFDVIEGKFVLTGADDGVYQVYTSSQEQDTYGLSDGFVFQVISGVAYDEAGQNEITDEIVLNLNEGIKIGDAYDINGNLTSEGTIRILRFVDNNGNKEWLGHTVIKPDGSMYITKEDGTYEITLEAWTDVFGKSIIVTISGETLTGGRDISYGPMQLSGEVFLEAGTPFTDYNYWVEVLDENKNHVTEARKTENNMSNFYYQVGGLEEGTYYVVLHTYQDLQDQGYASSEEVEIIIDANGDATPSAADLVLRKSADLPIEVVYNNCDYLPSYMNFIQIDVGLRYLNTSSVDDLSVELIPWDGSTEGTPLVLIDDPNNFKVLNYQGDKYQFVTSMGLGETLVADDSYILRITDNSTTPIKSVDTMIYGTDASILEGSNYIGNVNGELWHHLYFIYDQTATGAVTVYNANDEAVGSGSIEVFDDRFHDVLMKTTLDANAEPSYFMIDGAIVRGNGNEYYTTGTNDDYLWEVTADDTNYYIKMYNDNLTTDY